MGAMRIRCSFQMPGRPKPNSGFVHTQFGPLLAFIPYHEVTPMNPLNPKKLLLTKWTVVTPVAKQKHFLVSQVIKPALPTDPIELVEIESVFSKSTHVIPWRDLQNDNKWHQGWV